METGTPVCRICFSGVGDDRDEGQQLVSPCKCEGTQKYVHLECLRRWQRSVQLGGSNHPEDTAREDRHLICNVCKAPFNLPPQDRTAMMSDLACIGKEQVSPGMMLVTKKTEAESIETGAQLNIALRAFIETKAAHFRRAVYILTDVHPVDSSLQRERDGTDVVIGVNLSRPLEMPDVSKLVGAADRATIQSHGQKGVEVLWMNGGPVKPRAVTCLACIEHVPLAERAALLAQHDVQELVSGNQALVHGSMPGVLGVAAEEASFAAAAGKQRVAIVLAWAGFAQWNCTQLLGEIARGSWGWCHGGAADVAAAADAQLSPGVESLWASLRYSERLHWAPENELSREFESRFPPRSPGVARGELDRHAEAVGALVRQFEAIRRGGEASLQAQFNRQPRRSPSGEAESQAEASHQLGSTQAQSCSPQ